MGAGGGSNDPIYHYHSNYDSYHWMVTYGDPGFKMHVVMGQYLTLLAYNLASQEVIPFDVTNYPKQMAVYFDELKGVVADSSMTDLDISPIEDAIKMFEKAAEKTTKDIHKANKSKNKKLIDAVNSRLRDFERGFVSSGGLPNREFYKHVVFAPGVDTGYAPTTFPGVTEAITMSDDRELAEEWVKKTSEAIEVAAGILTK